MSGNALELRQIVQRFGAVVALNDAALSVRRGTVHAVLGENGAGKTTLMRVAYGLLRPVSGEVVVDGTPRRFSSPADAIAAGLGLVQQHPSNVGAMTVWENVVLGGSGALDPAAARRGVGNLTRELGFALHPDAVVGEMPVASQQRLEILKAIHRQARTLILDEPTAILAPEEATELYGWLRAFCDRGGTAVVVTHKLEEARRFTDDLTVLRAGRTVLQGRAAGIGADQLAQAMLGEAPPPPPRRSAARLAGAVVARADHLELSGARANAAVRHASFDLRAGEIVGVAGVEGSGHHELLLALAGRHPVKAGTLQTPALTSIVPEDRHRHAVVLEFSLTENAAIRNAAARRGRIDWKALEQRVSGFISRYDVRAPGPAAAMRALSGGNQQKFVIARELDGEPALVVAENPTRGLDIRAASFVRDQLRAARDRGAAVVMYSSDLDEILEMADRVLVVHAGVVSEQPMDRVRIGAAMLGAA